MRENDLNLRIIKNPKIIDNKLLKHKKDLEKIYSNLNWFKYCLNKLNQLKY